MVEPGTNPEDRPWMDTGRRIVVIGTSSHEPFAFPASQCGALNGLIGITHDAIVTQPGGPGGGGAGVLHLRDNLFFFEPVPPGTIIEMFLTDDQMCCTNDNFVIVACGDLAVATSSYRLFVALVH